MLRNKRRQKQFAFAAVIDIKAIIALKNSP